MVRLHRSMSVRSLLPVLLLAALVIAATGTAAGVSQGGSGSTGNGPGPNPPPGPCGPGGGDSGDPDEFGIYFAPPSTHDDLASGSRLPAGSGEATAETGVPFEEFWVRVLLRIWVLSR